VPRRKAEGIPSRGTPLRFAPFRPLPTRIAPSDDVAAVGPSPSSRTGSGISFLRPARPDRASPCAKVHARDPPYTFPGKNSREGPRLGPSGQRKGYPPGGLHYASLRSGPSADLPVMPGLSPRHARLRPGISLREGPPHGPSVHFSYTFLTRRSTPWTFRTTEGIPSRGTPLRFAPFRPLPNRNAPSDDVAAVGPSPYPCAGVHKPAGGYSLPPSQFSSLLSPVFKDEPRFKSLSSLFWALFKDETRF